VAPVPVPSHPLASWDGGAAGPIPRCQRRAAASGESESEDEGDVQKPDGTAPAAAPPSGPGIPHRPRTPLARWGGGRLTQAAVPKLKTLGVMYTCIARTFHRDRVFGYFPSSIFLCKFFSFPSFFASFRNG